jgi:nitrogen fixation protein NifU and related proteins
MASELLQSLAINPYHLGELKQPDAVGQVGMPGEGPFMKMYLRGGPDLIHEAWYETYNCPIAIGCGSFVTRWAEGRSFEQAKLLEAGDLMTVMGGLPLGKEHCAELAVGSLRHALDTAVR